MTTNEVRERVLPRPLIRAATFGSSINRLYTLLIDPDVDFMRPDQEYLLGHVLPPFQRSLVWEEDRMIAFIESAILGIGLGTYCVNVVPDTFTRDEKGNVQVPETDMWLIDGQQRFTALSRYFQDAFPVFGYHWSELPAPDQRDFRSIHFGYVELRSTDVDYLRVVYDRLNFGGIAHQDHERATTPEEEAAILSMR